uniref:Armadillo-like helical domain-containing protein 4 n=1 Tax=Astyanax mexicanus TaxID=7994 RepID=W5LMN8_ASTMX
MLFPTLFKGCSAILDVTLSTLWSALNASCSTLDKAMLLGETLKGLLVVGACLSAWAAPLGVTSSPQARRCDRTEQGSKETSESLESHHDDKLCEISTTQLPASSPPYVKEWREPGKTADVLDNARDEGEVTFAEAGKVQIRDSGLFQKEGDQNLSVDNVTFRSLSVDKNNISLSAGPTESVTSGPGNVNMEVESVTAAGASDQINSQSDAVQKVGPSVVPFGQSTGRSAETQVVLGHGEDVRQGSLLYTDLEEDKGRVRMRDLPPEHKREWDVESITKEHFTQLSTTEPSPVVSSTAHDSASQSPWTVVHPVSTSPTTPGIPDGEARRFRVAEENLFTASDLQDKALAPGILQPDLTLSSREPELGGTWTEPLHLQGVEETSISPLSQEVGTEATMSSEDLPLIFEPLDDVTPPSGSAQASELSVAMAPATGMLREAELEQAVSVDTERVPPDASILGPSDWPSPWQMSGSENSDAVAPYQMPVSRPFSGADLGPNISASVGTLPLSPSPVPATIHQDIESTQLTALQTKSGLDELESEEDEDEEDEDVDESEEEEEDSEEDLNEATVHTPTRASYSLIPPPPVWGQQNQGLIRSWVELIREKAGYVSGMLVPVGIGIAGALLIVGALYSIRMIHRKRKNSFKHQRRKQPKEVRTGPDQAMLLADSSEDEF